ncbi:fatty acid desaturase [Williamsia sp. Leaf354]|uniref:acyl-ACP desaturase n=1 Tax=Williamsia sp. Leaf354 TaxID=1736349 RepID=UPI0006F85278|nr:acyl-ACP desaturase [Williamsia sp. Leaf354]KQR97379.1 fatty acid desaturase [Williamsia sp. Leaf354]
MTSIADDELIMVLEKALPEIAEEHENNSITWNPHDLVPWDEGRNFSFLGGDDWEPGESTMSDEVRAAVLALLMTKENLPSFHRVLGIHFPPFSEWRALVGRWTAEDNRHSIALRDHLVVTRQVDPERVEALRLSHVTQGYQQNPESRTMSPAYVLATMAVHENQSVAFANRLAEKVETESLAGILRNVAKDDEIQASTFAAFLNATLNAQPDATVIAVATALDNAVPIGADISGFEAEQALIADYGDESVLVGVAKTLVEQLGLRSLDGLSDSAEAARQKLLTRADS